MSTKVNCTQLIYPGYHPLAFGPTRNPPKVFRAMVGIAFPDLYPTLMLIYTPTSSDEIDIVVAIVRAGARHVGSGEFGNGLDRDIVRRI